VSETDVLAINSIDRFVDWIRDYNAERRKVEWSLSDEYQTEWTGILCFVFITKVKTGLGYVF
jgi:preprotein translocase subunit SecE